MSNSSIRPGATIPAQGSYEGVLHIPESSSIIGAEQSDC